MQKIILIVSVFLIGALIYYSFIDRSTCEINRNDIFAWQLSAEEINKFETSIHSEKYKSSVKTCMMPQQYAAYTTPELTYRRKNEFPLFASYQLDPRTHLAQRITYNWDGIYHCYNTDTTCPPISGRQMTYEELEEKFNCLKTILSSEYGKPFSNVTKGEPFFPIGADIQKGHEVSWRSENASVYLRLFLTNDRATLKQITIFHS